MANNTIMESSYFTTSWMPSGNRLVTEAFCPGWPRSSPQVTMTSINETTGADLGVPWMVGLPSASEETEFWIVRDDGRPFVLTEGENDGGVVVTEWTSTDWPPDRPLVIASTGNGGWIPVEQPAATSAVGSAVPTPNGGLLLVEEYDPGVHRLTQLAPDGSDVTRTGLRDSVPDPLPDARLAWNPEVGLWAVYHDATRAHHDGVLGDDLEGGTLTVLRWNPETERVEWVGSATPLDDGSVLEGLGPIWADVDGDGRDDLVTTVSNAATGARLRVYSLEEGTHRPVVLGQSPAIEQGGLWLHLLAVGPLGPGGEIEIVEIRTPHYSGTVRYYRFDPEASVQDDNLKLVADTLGYTSHDMDSRNLDRVVVADFNGDGIPELVVQTQVKDVLVGLQRKSSGESGVETIWSIPLSSSVESNLAVSCSAETGIMELMFSTRSHHLVKARFAPTTVDAELALTGVPHDDDGAERLPVEQSSLSESVLVTSGCACGPHPQVWGQSVLLLGLSVLLLQRLSNEF